MIPIVYTSTLGVSDSDNSFLSRSNISYKISQTPQVWIDCQIAEENGGVAVNWDYRTGVFLQNVIRDMFEAFERVLKRLGKKDNTVLKETDPIGLPEKTQAVRNKVNATERELPESLMAEGFVKSCVLYPNKTALITKDGEYTYAALVMVIILFVVDWRFGLASLAGIILAFIAEFIGFGSGAMKENMGKYQKASEEMNNASVEYVRGMSVVKAFNQTASSFKKLQEAISGYTEWVLKFSLGWQNCMPAFTTIINNIYLILVPVGILIGSNTSNFKEFSMKFIFYLLFVPAIAGVLNKIMYISESFMQIDGNVARMDEILNIPEMPETANPQKPQGEDVVFDHVSFTYTGNNEEKALESVSFAAKQGQITAIVGPSGGGKSTIANLISRFWDVTDGKITIGGVDLRDMAQNDLMRQVSFVFQDIFLFKQSILDNIRMGNRNATEEQVIAAAKAAQCHEFISKLPEGYHTVVGTKGVHLSGGERQRIAIARAIIKDSPIIVLDEATAFSDPENEYLIQKAFEKLMQNKTVIIIAHRLSTIRNADKIIVMEKGQIVESGKHDDLVAAGGRYFQMWNHYTEAINWKLNGKAV